MLDNEKVIYLEIPAEYVCTYNKLVTYLSDYGMDLLNECDSACKQHNKNLIKCWNMFQAAIAAKSVGKDKEANVLITYINAQLEDIYKSDGEDIVYVDKILPINEEGKVYGTVTCKRIIDFYLHIDESTEQFKKGCLYVKALFAVSETISFENITDVNPYLQYRENNII